MVEKKSKPKPITQKRLMNIALHYLGRYESSVANLRQVLLRRIAKAKSKGIEISPQSDQWIESVIKQVRDLGYVNDERFARSVVEKYRQSGKSERYIRLKLTQAGINRDIQDGVFQSDDSVFFENSDLEAACRLVKKRKLGAFRSVEDRKNYYKKDLAVLARAGFSFEIAVQALNVEGQRADDEDRL